MGQDHRILEETHFPEKVVSITREFDTEVGIFVPFNGRSAFNRGGKWVRAEAHVLYLLLKP